MYTVAHVFIGKEGWEVNFEAQTPLHYQKVLVRSTRFLVHGVSAAISTNDFSHMHATDDLCFIVAIHRPYSCCSMFSRRKVPARSRTVFRAREATSDNLVYAIPTAQGQLWLQKTVQSMRLEPDSYSLHIL